MDVFQLTDQVVKEVSYELIHFVEKYRGKVLPILVEAESIITENYNPASNDFIRAEIKIRLIGTIIYDLDYETEMKEFWNYCEFRMLNRYRDTYWLDNGIGYYFNFEFNSILKYGGNIQISS